MGGLIFSGALEWTLRLPPRLRSGLRQNRRGLRARSSLHWNHAAKRYNRGVRIRFLIIFLALLTTVSLAQDSPDKSAAENSAARDREAQESSSRDTRIDLSPPKDDAKNHPASKAAVADLEPPTTRTPLGFRNSIPGTR